MAINEEYAIQKKQELLLNIQTFVKILLQLIEVHIHFYEFLQFQVIHYTSAGPL